MTITSAGALDMSDQYEPLLINNSSRTDNGEEITKIDDEDIYMVDYRGERVINGESNNKIKLGGWRSASLIIIVDIAEGIAYYGISSNLMNYLTGPLHESTVNAAANINTWVGFIWMLPVLGAFIEDSYLGRFRTIVFSTLIYVLGLGLLTLSVMFPSFITQLDCHNYAETNTSGSSPPFQVIFFFSSLYLVAIGRAGFKPCVQAFGSSISRLLLTYIEDNISWGLGFGIAFISLGTTLIVFLLGMKTYRYTVKKDKQNPLLRIGQVFVAAAKNWRISSSSAVIQDVETQMSYGNRVGVHQFKFLDKAMIDVSNEPSGSTKHGMQCSINQVEDAKVVLRLVPIWITCLTYAVVFAQYSTFFIKQGSTMDRSMGPTFQVPAASLQFLINLCIFLFIPMYEGVFVPLVRVFTGKPNGITMLQRIGIGMLISTLSMVIAAIIEKKRLLVALDSGLIDTPEVTVPMSVWWLAPQYILIGLGDVFTNIGLQEFFYDQVPDQLRSIGVSLYLSILGVGSLLSGLLISAIEKVTGGSGHYSWFSDNLNRAHLDYFYWLLAALSLAEVVAFLYISKSYLYKRGASM